MPKCNGYCKYNAQVGRMQKQNMYGRITVSKPCEGKHINKPSRMELRQIRDLSALPTALKFKTFLDTTIHFILLMWKFGIE